MSVQDFQPFQKGLEAKRRNVTEFLETAPKSKVEMCCADTSNAQAHLQVIEDALRKTGDRTLGICELCQEYVEPRWLEMDYTASICLDHMSETERRSLEAELELSRMVQRALLPQIVPAIPGAELAAFSRPAEIVGGDYFDFFQYRGGGQGLVIADIPGHGVSAGMLMSSLQAAIRTLAPEKDSPAEILEHINRFYIHNIHFTTFVTVFLASYNPQTRSLNYANSGHNPPAIVRRSDSGVTWLKPTAPAIGLSEEYHPRMERVSLARGDVLFMYTDGVTEAVDPGGNQYGSVKLVEALIRSLDLRPEEMIRLVRTELEAFVGDYPIQDDTTFIALKIMD